MKLSFQKGAPVYAKMLMVGVLAGAVALTVSAADDPPKPPKGWAEYIPASKAFGVWLPEGGKRSERSRDMTFGTARLKISLVQVEKDKMIFRAEQVSLPVKPGERVDTTAALEVFRDAFVKDVDGLVTSDSDIKLGKMSGKEYIMDAGKSNQAKLRIYVTGPRVYLISMIGTKSQIESETAKLFFDSYKHAGMVKDELAGKDPPKDIDPKATGDAVVPVKGKDPVMLGHPFDPQFKDLAPEGGLLVGFEIGTAKAFNRDMTRSVRPIYRVGDKESFGEQRGTQLQNVVTIKAKAGYAVGAISCMHGLGFDGISVTFMKVTDGKLDPKDTYESQYIGSDQKKPLTKIGGDGTLVIGIVGRTNAKDMTAMGLLFKGQEGFEPKKN